MELIVLPPRGAVDTEQPASGGPWQWLERVRHLGLRIVSSCEEKGAVISKPSFSQSRDLSTCYDS